MTNNHFILSTAQHHSFACGGKVGKEQYGIIVARRRGEYRSQNQRRFNSFTLRSKIWARSSYRYAPAEKRSDQFQDQGSDKY